MNITHHFRTFLQERPATSPDRLAGELGTDRPDLQKIITGKRNVPQHRRGDFSRLMARYGCLAHIGQPGQAL